MVCGETNVLLAIKNITYNIDHRAYNIDHRAYIEQLCATYKVRSYSNSSISNNHTNLPVIFQCLLQSTRFSLDPIGYCTASSLFCSSLPTSPTGNVPRFYSVYHISTDNGVLVCYTVSCHSTNYITYTIRHVYITQHYYMPCIKLLINTTQ